MTPEDYRKILSLAIDREVESYTFYRGISDKVKDNNLKKLFNELAGEETKHRQLLEGLMSRDVKELKFSAAKDYKIADQMAAPKLSMDLKPIDGIVLAIRKELEAMQMYTQLAGHSTDAGQKKMFTELATMERGHKARLEDLYTEMAFPEVW
ncbi:rubrerythrin [Methanolinea mesophila]|uniref:ferritin-like domain-containing protein n=1 Tax=Methanolinea mesophila TaxID=547055 RepID=UPI001AE70AB2|nr:ferritin family protein [Methanolinea mesophila]MBP1928209.1 rubrerythrin [Methanolinea mesophila]